MCWTVGSVVCERESIICHVGAENITPGVSREPISVSSIVSAVCRSCTSAN
jgi:hypothetical protein